MRWFVVDTRVWEIDAPSDSEAIALLEDQPELTPTYHTTTAERVAAKPTAGPVLRVLP